MVGAAPAGASDPRTASRAVREMFTSIAPRYDLLNHVLSFNVDRLWWRRTARTFDHILSRPRAHVLDLCCGTGDMTFALLRQAGDTNPQILGADFSHAMLQRARLKSSRANLSNGKAATPHWIEADALNLPFPDTTSIWSPPPSASAISPTTTPDSARSRACCVRAGSAASSTSASLME